LKARCAGWSAAVDGQIHSFGGSIQKLSRPFGGVQATHAKITRVHELESLRQRAGAQGSEAPSSEVEASRRRRRGPLRARPGESRATSMSRKGRGPDRREREISWPNKPNRWKHVTLGDYLYYLRGAPLTGRAFGLVTLPNVEDICRSLSFFSKGNDVCFGRIHFATPRCLHRQACPSRRYPLRSVDASTLSPQWLKVVAFFSLWRCQIPAQSCTDGRPASRPARTGRCFRGSTRPTGKADAPSFGRRKVKRGGDRFAPRSSGELRQ
jgi:hypothetical protein